MSKRILLDENFPVDFAREFSDHEVHTVHSLGWSGIKNGELLRRAHAVCDVFVTLVMKPDETFNPIHVDLLR